jgi:hypothetical protein
MSNKGIWDLLGVSKVSESENANNLSNAISIFDLLVWEDSLKPATQGLSSNNNVQTTPIVQSSPTQEDSTNDEFDEPSKFPYLPEINKKIILW